MLEKLEIFFSSDDIDLDDIESDIFTFFSDGRGRNTLDLNNINLHDHNFNNDDPEFIIDVRLTVSYNSYKGGSEYKKDIN